MKHPLTRIVPWGQELLAEVVEQGDLVVDLTAGTGQDTLALYRFVGRSGQVLSFDIQADALDRTAALLERNEGLPVRLEKDQVPSPEAGVYLIADGHENLEHYVGRAPKGIIANLGYLPGGDQAIITKPESTLSALRQGLQLLAVGGRLAVVVYPGHPGGAEEGQAVAALFEGLSEKLYQVLLLKVTNRPQAPFLYVIEKLMDSGGTFDL